MSANRPTESIFLCCACDANHVQMQLAVLADEVDPHREHTCVKDWLKGQMLSIDDDGQSTACSCFQEDPYPPAEWPGMTNQNRRYFYYKSVARKLGAKGKNNRVKLPSCVVKQIETLHPRTNGEPAKVGFKRVRSS